MHTTNGKDMGAQVRPARRPPLPWIASIIGDDDGHD